MLRLPWAAAPYYIPIPEMVTLVKLTGQAAPHGESAKDVILEVLRRMLLGRRAAWARLLNDGGDGVACL